MAIYTVHVPKGRPLLATADDVRFVPEEFSRRALVFGPFWLLWNRLWIEGAIAFAVAFTWLLIVSYRGWPADTFWAGEFLLHLALGFEGRSLLRAALARRDYALTDVVMGDTLAAAEAHFFARWLMNPSSAVGTELPQSGGTRRMGQPPDVIGLFPEAGARR